MNRIKIIESIPTNMDKMLIAHVLDKIDRGEFSNVNVYSNFLDPAVASFIGKALNIKHFSEDINSDTFLYGGYEYAERVSLVIKKDEYWKSRFKVIRVTPIANKIQNITLSHRDYLGSLMALGIKRECLGDIIVSETFADIIAIEDICEHILRELESVSKLKLNVSIYDIDEITIKEDDVAKKSITVSSSRLDSIIGKAFNLSRERAKEVISSGKTFVNFIKVYKNDMSIKQGDFITVRGMGRIKIISIKEPNKKGKIPIIFE